MSSTMTLLEAAERLKDIKEQMLDNISFDDAHTLDYVASMLHRIAAGEYKPVVHAHWIPGKAVYGEVDICSRCGDYFKKPHEIFKSCPNCSALMDEFDMRQMQNGKDDSHETD